MFITNYFPRPPIAVALLLLLCLPNGRYSGIVLSFHSFLPSIHLIGHRSITLSVVFIGIIGNLKTTFLLFHLKNLGEALHKHNNEIKKSLHLQKNMCPIIVLSNIYQIHELDSNSPNDMQSP